MYLPMAVAGRESNNVLTNGNGRWYSIIGRSSTNTTVTMITESSTISNPDLHEWFFPPSFPLFSETDLSLDAMEDERGSLCCDCCNAVFTIYYALNLITVSIHRYMHVYNLQRTL